MSKLVKNGEVIQDNWKTLRLTADDTPHSIRLPVGPVLVPVSVWKARRAELIRREYEHGWPLGVWLAADESPASIEQDLDDFSVIAVQFDRFGDGNSYLTARLLRDSYGYRGELRAIGDVPGSKLAYLRQLGFDVIVAGGRFIGALVNLADIKEAKPRLVTAA